MTAERMLAMLVLLSACPVPHNLGDLPFETDPSAATTAGEAGGDASISSTTISGGEITGGSDVSTGGFDPYAQCGVELEYGGPHKQWTCGCALCDIDQEDLTDESRDSFLGACECLCDAFGCGGSTTITTGATTEDGSGGSGTSDESSTGESTGIAESTDTTGATETGPTSSGG
jgi:hypothetical protein